MILLACLAGCGALFGGAGRPETEGDIPEGTMMWVRLEKPLSSRYSHLGEPIRARTVSEVQSETGEVLVPRNALILGQVSRRIGDAIWLDLETLEYDGLKQRVRARFVGAEAGFTGRLHAGDELAVRLDRPMWSIAAMRQAAARQY